MAQNQAKRMKTFKTNSSDKELPSKGEPAKKNPEHGHNQGEFPKKASDLTKSGGDSSKKSLEQSKTSTELTRRQSDQVKKSLEQSKTSTELTRKHVDPVKAQGDSSKGQGAKPKINSTKKVLKIERNQGEAKKILCQMNSQLTELLLGRASMTESPTDLTRRSFTAIQTLSKDIVVYLDRPCKKSGFLEDIGQLLQECSKLRHLLNKCESSLKSEKDLVKFHTNRCRTFQNERERLKMEKKQTEDRNSELEDKIIELDTSIIQMRQSHQNAIRIFTDKHAHQQDKLNKYEFSLSSNEEKNNELLKDNQTLKDKILDLEHRNKTLEKKCQEYHKDSEKANHKTKLLENKHKKLQSEMDVMNVRNIELRSKNKTIVKESNHSEGKIRDLEEKVQTLTSELQECHSENDQLQEQNHLLNMRLSKYENENESDLMKIEDYTEALAEQEERMMKRRFSGSFPPAALQKLKRDDSEHSLISCANSGLSSTLESHGRVSRLTKEESELSEVSFANSSHSDEVPR